MANLSPVYLPAPRHRKFLSRLDFRLLTAFSLVLLMTLAISLIALVVVLRAQPADTDSILIDLASASFDIRQRAIDERNSSRFNLEDYVTYLQEQAATHDVRILILNGANDTWLVDTGADFPRPLNEEFEREPFLNQPARPGSTLETALFKGTFTDSADKSWLFVQQPFFTTTGLLRRNQTEARLSLVVATPMPEQTVQTVINENLDNGLFLALVQASLIGLLVAFILAFLIMRWISHPLLAMATAAVKVALGDFSTRAAVRGPAEIQTVAIAFNEMTARVELSQQAQQDFLANVSHDLRTPLTSIQGFAQAIMEGVADEDTSRHAATIIYSEASRMSRMVSELLDLARIQAGRMDMRRQAVHLDKILRNVGESLAIRANEKGITLALAIPELPRIAGDGDRLAQVFTNLVDNALKHTEASGYVTLTAFLDNPSGGVLVHVQDTGEGIPTEDLPRIFERFYQVDKSRAKRAGTGLGLAITREIVQAHAGRIWVESETGKGTRFSVWLPQPMHDKQETVLQSRQKA